MLTYCKLSAVKGSEAEPRSNCLKLPATSSGTKHVGPSQDEVFIPEKPEKYYFKVLVLSEGPMHSPLCGYCSRRQEFSSALWLFPRVFSSAQRTYNQCGRTTCMNMSFFFAFVGVSCHGGGPRCIDFALSLTVPW